MDKWKVWTQTSATWEGNGLTLQSKCHRSNPCCPSQSCSHAAWKSQHSAERKSNALLFLYQKLKWLYLLHECENICKRWWVPLIAFSFIFYVTAPQMNTHHHYFSLSTQPAALCVVLFMLHKHTNSGSTTLYLTETDRREQQSQAVEIKRQRG